MVSDWDKLLYLLLSIWGNSYVEALDVIQLRLSLMGTALSDGDDNYCYQYYDMVLSPSIQLHGYKSCKTRRIPARIKRADVG